MPHMVHAPTEQKVDIISNKHHLDCRPIQRAIGVILLIFAIGLPSYLVLSPHASFSEASVPK